METKDTKSGVVGNSSQAGYPGEYPGTYSGARKVNYNGLEIALVGNDSSALGADHNRVPNETITPFESRGITGPLVQPVGQRIDWPTGEDKTKSGLHGQENSIKS